MSGELRVSVVLPVRDDAPALRRCLEALATLTDAPDEIVVVDNGSSDDTADVARAGGARVVFEPVEGIASAAAAGYDAATGDVLVRFDSDAVPPVDWIARIRAAFAADPGLAGMTGPGVFTDLPWPARLLAGLGYHGAYFGLVGTLLGRVPLYGSNLAVRRTAWLEVRDRFHRQDPMVHDDLCLTVHLGDRRLRFDPRIGVAVSARAVTPRRLATAAGKTRHTVRVHATAFRATTAGRLLGPLLGGGPPR
ncbi:glycosyltransferase family A protein [Amnibacterium sp.]|uniref:glycosyltransferase family A protein n=1 Tax=Amnibacterium sp. TaxID=1872496 RepID=UPI002623ACB7|nr:glycosyltransferase family A protein [Amnibacterium sp.]MCU1473789.1 glycosyl transferase family 2 [Amnibacterium sp.]